MTVLDLLEQPCNKSDDISKLVEDPSLRIESSAVISLRGVSIKLIKPVQGTYCSKLVDNLDKPCEHNLLTACLQTCYKL